MRTIVCKLKVAPDAIPALEATFKAFADACNFVADWGRRNKVSAQFKLHAATYRDIRSKFGLSSNLAVRAIARVSISLRKRPKCFFKPASVDYDVRIFRFWERDWMVSLTLLDGRHKFSLVIGQYQRDALAGKTPTSAVLTKRDGNYYIGIHVKDGNIPLQPPGGTLGVDLGLTDIATLSDGTRFCGQKMTAQRLQRAKVRRSLQSKAAKGKRAMRRSARRCLGRLKGREARFAKWVNHNISKVIVAKARTSNVSIALEDLTGIRDRTNKKLRKKQRGLHNSWAFYQLRQFISYKAALAGVTVVAVDPHYTSQTCAVCHTRGKRKGKVFACTSCGTRCDADWNAARNIAQLGRPIIPSEKSTSGSFHELGLKPAVYGG